MERSITEVGRIFRDRRKFLGLTQQQVVEIAERHFGHRIVGESTYRQFESGRADGVSDRTARGAAVALRWPLDAVSRIGAGEDPAQLPDVNHEAEESVPPWEDLLDAMDHLTDEVRRLRQDLTDQPENAT